MVGPIAFGIVVQDVSFSAAWVGAAVLAGMRKMIACEANIKYPIAPIPTMAAVTLKWPCDL